MIKKLLATKIGTTGHCNYSKKAASYSGSVISFYNQTDDISACASPRVLQNYQGLPIALSSFPSYSTYTTNIGHERY